MATIEENKSLWESQYEWPEAGDEWSVPWGGTQNLWEYVISLLSGENCVKWA